MKRLRATNGHAGSPVRVTMGLIVPIVQPGRQDVFPPRSARDIGHGIRSDSTRIHRP
ncbi:MAG: hypothetical protein IT428_04250 [Planctomycetaceae bacterium]|nr:hypothetical protein [Planctomycetaceae bacterium]